MKYKISSFVDFFIWIKVEVPEFSELKTVKKGHLREEFNFLIETFLKFILKDHFEGFSVQNSEVTIFLAFNRSKSFGSFGHHSLLSKGVSSFENFDINFYNTLFLDEKETLGSVYDHIHII